MFDLNEDYLYENKKAYPQIVQLLDAAPDEDGYIHARFMGQPLQPVNRVRASKIRQTVAEARAARAALIEAQRVDVTYTDPRGTHKVSGRKFRSPEHHPGASNIEITYMCDHCKQKHAVKIEDSNIVGKVTDCELCGSHENVSFTATCPLTGKTHSADLYDS